MAPLAGDEQGRRSVIHGFVDLTASRKQQLNDLIVTLPTRATRLKHDHPRVVIREVPFAIPPLELKMAWSPLLHNNAPHRWVRQFITGIARALPGDTDA